jgi:hypothetical protein
VAASHDSGVPAGDIAEQGRRLEEKFMSLAVPVIGEAKAHDMVGRVGALERLDDLRRTMRLCAAG